MGSVVLVNANEMKPPVAPLALDYLGGPLRQAGFEVHLVDLSFAEDPMRALATRLGSVDPFVIGVTFRNTDDCFWPSCAWFVPRLRELVETIRAHTSAPLALGGCGFSLFPRQIMDLCGADLGVVGDGEKVFTTLTQRLADGADTRGIPGLAVRGPNGVITLSPPDFASSLSVPTRRDVVDNPRYLREGGMGNIETKRGCPHACIYCADPVAKGSRARCRDPREVADELESLVHDGVDVLHLCDAEFNVPSDHALAVCREILARRLGDRLRWYCYATVKGFSGELARAMRRAGCVGINFGVDSGCDRMLHAYRRGYTRQAIREAVRSCREAGISVMLDLLLGGPGEDRASVVETVEFIRDVDPDRAGAATGVRLYPGTPMGAWIASQGPMPQNPNLCGQLEDNEDFLRPVFYIDRQLGEDPPALVRDVIGDDERFFKPAPVDQMVDYNYNDNPGLSAAIAAGHRGAFWDIFRKLAEGIPP